MMLMKQQKDCKLILMTRVLKEKTKNELNEPKIINAAYNSMKKDKHKTQYTEQNQLDTLTNDSMALAGEAYKEEHQYYD